MRVLVVSEFYPRAHDPVLGIWAHRQALAARDAGADVRVCVLYRPIPPSGSAAKLGRYLRQRPRATLDGLTVDYVPFLAPPRPKHYGRWGAWAAPTLAAYLRTHRFDLVHAHNAVPAADAVRRARIRKPLVVSVHGGDVLYTAPRYGEQTVRPALERATLVLANSQGTAKRAERLGAKRTRVVHLGADLADGAGHRDLATVATVGHLVARKRHADVLRALWALRERQPLRHLVIGDGPEREQLERLADELGVEADFAGQLPHDEALARLGEAALFVLPSTDEAFGVAYVEAMAAGVPAIGCRGEDGPEEIAAAGGGIRLVPPGDIEALAREIAAIMGEERYRLQLGREARATVEEHFTWERCGRETVAAYEEALRA